MDADTRVLVACRLDPADAAPDLHTLAQALTRPERPLFIGRKPFVPSRPLLLGIVEAETIPQALVVGLAQINAPRRDAVRAQWPHGEVTGAAWSPALAAGAQEEALTDERHWPSGVHAGLRRVVHGRLAWPAAETAA
jgi:CRISPR system Cascade subunit CasD